MLFERWQETLERNATEFALRDQATGRDWTFRDLHERLGGLPVAAEPVPLQGRSVDFVVDTLRAWRDRQIAVPLEDEATFDLDSRTLVGIPDDIVHVKTTSGSTGAPRRVLFTAGQLEADADQIVTTMGLRSDCPNIGVISLAHSYGFSNLVLPLLLHGIPLVLIENPLPELVRAALAGIDQATVPAVPAMWRSWHTAGLVTSKVKLAISAGAPLPTELERAVHDSTGVKIHNFLGASECGGIAYDRSDDPREPGTDFVGSAMDGVTLGISDEGTLQVCSRAVGATYWPKPDPTLGEGRFLTTDLVRLDGDRVHLVGRAGDVINLAGRKVHPSELEHALLALPGVCCCVVFGIPSKRRGRVDEIVAGVKLTESTSLADVRSAIAGNLPAWKTPKYWVEFPDLEPDTRGKISRPAWRDRYFVRTSRGASNE